ncbi:cytochrome c oxidase subunit 6B2-like [Episyrphus balteatus]|uniref:cytochrome c oxidase subunit 6B2-like n=1 Tax=Episyrphus balteatus TaxID=286459 RepID=UPI0024851EF7|nr:cytochrome c oxidase subunit 6B2-like [Episyrphus balteatus]
MPKKKEPVEIKLGSVPKDPRFPSQNQTRYCYESYCDYFRCMKKLEVGQDQESCNYFKKAFTVMCPNDWISKWNDQREAGTFPGRI